MPETSGFSICRSRSYRHERYIKTITTDEQLYLHTNMHTQIFRVSHVSTVYTPKKLRVHYALRLHTKLWYGTFGKQTWCLKKFSVKYDIKEWIRTHTRCDSSFRSSPFLSFRSMFGLELGFYGNITVSPHTKEYHSWGGSRFFYWLKVKGQYLKLWACLVKRNFISSSLVSSELGL